MKAEQTGRIGFRDNMIYVTLASVGVVVSFSLSKEGPIAALLVVPWVTFVLGWTYVVNDEKISAIGRYIRLTLQPRIRSLVERTDDVFGWEIAHRSDKLRVERKWVQFFVDLVAFVGPGVGAIVVYLVREPHPARSARLVCVLGGALMVVLALEISRYLDWRLGR